MAYRIVLAYNNLLTPQLKKLPSQTTGCKYTLNDKIDTSSYYALNLLLQYYPLPFIHSFILSISTPTSTLIKSFCVCELKQMLSSRKTTVKQRRTVTDSAIDTIATPIPFNRPHSQNKTTTNRQVSLPIYYLQQTPRDRRSDRCFGQVCRQLLKSSTSSGLTLKWIEFSFQAAVVEALDQFHGGCRRSSSNKCSWESSATCGKCWIGVGGILRVEFKGKESETWKVLKWAVI